jgi:hypothetical protein
MTIFVQKTRGMPMMMHVTEHDDNDLYPSEDLCVYELGQNVPRDRER